VFEPPPQYPVVDVSPSSQLLHGSNLFGLFTSADQQILLEALVLRRNSEKRLVDRKFLLPSRKSSWVDIRLPPGINPKDFLATPAPSEKARRRVVAIDCEMVGVLQGKPSEKSERSELAQLCAVDVLTGEILIDKLVSPGEGVINWRTRYSGISPSMINSARAGGRLLRGWRSARAELWNYIDADTLLVGHDLQSDLHVLRIAHVKIIDTTMQTAEAVFGDVQRFRRTWGLKELANSLLGIKVQVGKRGHDCVEDTLTTRELALWCIRLPADLESWAVRMRHDLKKKEAERKEKESAEKEAENLA
jgi:DNA polymerase III epsilon subunit-like protein